MFTAWVLAAWSRTSGYSVPVQVFLRHKMAANHNGTKYARIRTRAPHVYEDEDDDDHLGVVPVRDPDNDVNAVHAATQSRGGALEKLYREWRDSDPDAIDSSAFSESGFICSPRAQVWLGIIGAILAVVPTWYMAHGTWYSVTEGTPHFHHHRFNYLAFNAMAVAYTGVYLVAVCVLVYKNRQPRALVLSKHGLLPAMFLQLTQTVCDAGGTYGDFWEAKQFNSTASGGRAFCVQASAVSWQGICWWAFPSGEAYCSDPRVSQSPARHADGKTQYYLWAEIGQNVTAWLKSGHWAEDHQSAAQGTALVEWNIVIDGALLLLWMVLNGIVYFPGRYQLVLMTAAAAIFLFGWVICLHLNYGLRHHFQHVAFGYPCFLLYVAVALCWNRYTAKAKAKLLIQDDLKDYDRVWSECKQGMHQHTTVTSPAARPLLNGGDTGGVCQKLVDFCTRWKVILPPSPQPLQQPVNSISALFAQADAVNDWYQDKVEGWHGKLQTFKSEARANGAAHADSRNGTTAPPPAFSRASVKKPLRAIQKIRRSYAGHVGRVCDLVRGSIVCSTFEELAYIAGVVHQDEDVVIVRGKNRLDDGYDATSGSGGYRDAQLSLKLVGYPLQQHSRHIAELQFHLLPIYKLKIGFESPTDHASHGQQGADGGTPVTQLHVQMAAVPRISGASAYRHGDVVIDAGHRGQDHASLEWAPTRATHGLLSRLLSELRYFLFLLGLPWWVGAKPQGDRGEAVLTTGHQRYVKWRTIMCK